VISCPSSIELPAADVLNKMAAHVQIPNKKINNCSIELWFRVNSSLANAREQAHECCESRQKAIVSSGASVDMLHILNSFEMEQSRLRALDQF
jgi:hypothetical protein